MTTNNDKLRIKRKILIMGLPGSGKTTLAEKLVPRLNAAWFNADAVRQEIHRTGVLVLKIVLNMPKEWANLPTGLR